MENHNKLILNLIVNKIFSKLMKNKLNKVINRIQKAMVKFNQISGALLKSLMILYREESSNYIDR